MYKEGGPVVNFLGGPIASMARYLAPLVILSSLVQSAPIDPSTILDQLKKNVDCVSPYILYAYPISTLFVLHAACSIFESVTSYVSAY